jgi:hypothetical protein
VADLGSQKCGLGRLPFSLGTFGKSKPLGFTVLVTLVRLETGPAPLRGRNFLTFKIFPNPLSLPLPLARPLAVGRLRDDCGTAPGRLKNQIPR